MPTAADCEIMIQRLDDWDKLRTLWEKIKADDTPDWPPGKAFEYLVLQAFRLDGGVVRWPYDVPLENEVVEQIDGAVHIGRFSCIVESKKTAGPIAIAPLAKMRNQLLRRHSGIIGLIFSYSGFTGPALTLARYIAPQAILLWYGEEVDQVLQDRKILDFLEFKYQSSVETGVPDATFERATSSGSNRSS
jgi:hypothetical protein